MTSTYDPDSNANANAPQRNRGGCLTAFLVLMMIVNPLTALFYLLGGEQAHRAIPQAPGWVIPVLGVACLGNLACAIAVWSWKKWGMYGFLGISALGFGVNLFAGLGAGALTGLIGPALLLALVYPQWNSME